MWRIALGLGAIPPLSVFYFRLKMKEGDRYAADGMRHAKIPYWLVIKKYWTRLIPVSLIWFLYDFSAYSFGIYSSTILQTVIPNSVFRNPDCVNCRRCINHLDGMLLFFYFIFLELLSGHLLQITWVQNLPLPLVYLSKQFSVLSCLAFIRNSPLKSVRSSLCVCSHLHIYSDRRRSIFVIWRIRTG